MLLVIDVGNTHTVCGVFEADELLHHWRVVTEPERTVDEFGLLLGNLFTFHGIRRNAIKGLIISSVVPPMLPILEEVAERYFHTKPLVVGPGIKTGMPIFYDNPTEVGADRIVNAVAAYELYHQELIVVDFGTATTFDYVTAKGEYMGGAIAPGIGISMEALFQRASKLPRVELLKPKGVIGKNTIHSMQSGIFYGYVGLVDEMVRRMREETRSDPHVLATGGWARLIASESTAIHEVDDLLTLRGLKIIYQRNLPRKK
jgi:type III pantothenate kinase